MLTFHYSFSTFRVLDYRPIHVESGVLSLANGSARVRIGGEETDVLVSVKADLITEDSIGESLPNRLKFFIDFSAIASPEFAGLQLLAYLLELV